MNGRAYLVFLAVFFAFAAGAGFLPLAGALVGRAFVVFAGFATFLTAWGAGADFFAGFAGGATGLAAFTGFAAAAVLAVGLTAGSGAAVGVALLCVPFAWLKATIFGPALTLTFASSYTWGLLLLLASTINATRGAPPKS